MFKEGVRYKNNKSIGKDVLVYIAMSLSTTVCKVSNNFNINIPILLYRYIWVVSRKKEHHSCRSQFIRGQMNITMFKSFLFMQNIFIQSFSVKVFFLYSPVKYLAVLKWKKSKPGEHNLSSKLFFYLDMLEVALGRNYAPTILILNFL